MSDSPLFNPFPGLRPFRSDEKHLFFGREDQTGELLRRLRQSRFLAVVGSSGSGKSSLVRAGMLPELHGGIMTSAGSHWEVVVMRPGGDPLTNLAKAMVDADLYDPEDEGVVDQVRTTLDRSALGLSETVRQSDVEEGTNVLVVVDQFEEIFRFREQGGQSQQEALAFVKLLLEAAKEDSPPVYVVLTMRSDYLGDCAQFRGLAQAVNEGEYLIPRLTRKQRRAAIEGPIRVGGADISKRLLTKLLNDVGDDPDQLPVLQHALMRTWDSWALDHQEGEEVELRHYEATGGMKEALSRHADEIFERLPSDSSREVGERVFKALTERIDEVRGIRRPQRLEHLVEIVGASEEDVVTVVDAYRASGCTFLMPPETKDLDTRTIIDISHESLMRVWQRLRHWVDEEAQSAGIYRRLAETAQLRADGKAGLYHDPDLQIALSWREELKPSAAWAGQYGGGFEDAMGFLETSRETVAKQEREREAARQRELDQAHELATAQSRAARNFQRFAIGVSLLAVVAVALSVWAFRLRNEATANALAARTSAEEAVEEREKARAAEKTFRREQGNVWLERAQLVANEKDHFASRMLAGRAVGFEGLGRENQDEAFHQRFPILLESDTVESRRAHDLVASTPRTAPMWRGAVRTTIGEPWRVTVDPKGQYFAASNLEGDIFIWDVVSGDLRYRHQGQGFPVYIEALADGESLLVAEVAADKTTVTRRALDPAVSLAFEPLELVGRTLRARATPDTERCLISLDVLGGGHSGNGTCVWLDTHHMKVITERIEGEEAAESTVNAIAHHPTEDLFVTGRRDGTLEVWGYTRAPEKEGVKRLTHLPEHFASSVRFLCFSSDGRFLLVCEGGSDAVAGFRCSWDADSNTIGTPEPLDAISGDIAGIAAHPTEPDKIFVSGGERATDWSMHDFATGELLVDLKEAQGEHPRRVPSYDDMGVSPDGRLVFRTMESGRIEVVNLETMETAVEGPTGSGGGRILKCVFSPDGRWLLAQSVAGRGSELVDLRSGTVAATIGKIAGGAVFSADGSQLVVSTRSDGWVLDIYEVGGALDQPVASYPLRSLSGVPRQLVVSGDGKFLAFMEGLSGRILCWSFEDHRLVDVSHDEEALKELRQQQAAQRRRGGRSSQRDRVYDLAFAPSGTWLAEGHREGATIWDVVSRTVVAELPSRVGVFAVAFSPDGRHVATGGVGTSVALWDVTTTPPTIEALLNSHAGGYIRSLDFSPDGGLLASAGDDGAVTLWDPATREIVERLGGSHEWDGEFNQGVHHVRFAPDGQSLALVEGTMPQTTVALWELDREVGAVFETQESTVASPRFLDDRTLLVGGDGALLVMDRVSRQVRQRIPFPGLVNSLALSEDARYAGVYCHRGGMPGVSVVDLSTGEVVGRKAYQGQNLIDMGFSADSKRFAATAPGEVLVFDLENGALRTLATEGRSVWAVVYSLDGSKLYLGDNEGYVTVLDTESFEEVDRFQCSARTLTGLDVDPTGRYLATGGHDATVRLWRLDNGEHTLCGEASSGRGFIGVEFHPQEPLLATVGNAPGTEGGLKLHRFSPSTGELETMMTHEPAGASFAVSFSPSGRFVTASNFESRFTLLPVDGSGQGSDLGRYLGYYQISGRKVVPRGQYHLYRPATFSFDPRLESTHYQVLAREGSAEEVSQALLRHYLDHGASQAAMVVYQQMADAEGDAMKGEMVAGLTAQVEQLVGKGALAEAESELARARQLAGDAALDSVSFAMGELRLAAARDDAGDLESLARKVMALADQEGDALALQRVASILMETAEKKIEAGDFAGSKICLAILWGVPPFDAPAVAAPLLRRYVTALRAASALDTLQDANEPLDLGLALCELGLELWLGEAPLARSRKAFRQLHEEGGSQQLIYQGPPGPLPSVVNFPATVGIVQTLTFRVGSRRTPPLGLASARPPDR